MPEPASVHLPDGTTVVIHDSATGGPDRTSTGTWLAQCVCSGTPGRAERVEVVFGPAEGDAVPPVTVSVTWRVAPKPPPITPVVAPGRPPGLVVPTQRPGAAPPASPPA